MFMHFLIQLWYMSLLIRVYQIDRKSHLTFDCHICVQDCPRLALSGCPDVRFHGRPAPPSARSAVGAPTAMPSCSLAILRWFPKCLGITWGQVRSADTLLGTEAVSTQADAQNCGQHLCHVGYAPNSFGMIFGNLIFSDPKQSPQKPK